MPDLLAWVNVPIRVWIYIVPAEQAEHEHPVEGVEFVSV